MTSRGEPGLASDADLLPAATGQVILAKRITSRIAANAIEKDVPVQRSDE